jgi:GDP-4-dehydro-6-deoxy-D-mannose reductase
MTHGATLVTGATGFAGGHLLERLCQRETTPSIEAWSRPGGQAEKTAPHVRWRRVDLLDARAVGAAIAESRPAAIYHLAGAAHVGASWDRSTQHLETHVLGTHHLLDAVLTHVPQCRVLVVSSGMIYRPQDHPVSEQAPLGPVSPYALSKLAEDQLALHAAAHDGLDIVVARPFNHIGPGQSPDFAASSFAKQIAAIESGALPRTITVGNLETARDLTDVRDVVTAYVALMGAGHRGTAYNVCRGTTVVMSDLLDRLLAMSNVEVTREQDPERLRPNDLPFLAGDASLLRAHTGWAPRIALETTLADLLTFWRRTLAQPS